MDIFSNKTNFLGKLSFVSTLSCKAMENNSNFKLKSNDDFNFIKNESEDEKLFNNVLNKKYDKSNGELKLFRKATNRDIIISETLLMTINNNEYYMLIGKNNGIPYLNCFDNTDIEYLSLFTAKRPIPSLKNCDKLTKIKLSFDDEGDTEYLKDILEVIKNVKNLKELNLSYLYYYCNRFNKDILIIIDNIITSLKEEFPNLKYIFPNIYNKNSCDYNFIDFKNKKEIFDIVTIDSETLFSDYRIVIGKNLETLSNYNYKINNYIKKVREELFHKREYLNEINKLIESKEYLNGINELKEKIKNYEKLNSNLSYEKNLADENIIRNLSRELNINDKNNEKKILEEQIIKLEKEENDAISFPSDVEEKIKLLNEEKSFIENIENKINKNEYDNININEVYDFMLKLRTEGENLDIIHPFGQECSICADNIMIQDIRNDNIKKTPCNHIFHKKCINLWLNKQKTCPLCRGKIDNNQ